MEGRGGIGISAVFLVVTLMATFVGCALFWNNLSREPKVIASTAEGIAGITKAVEILILFVACAMVFLGLLYFGGPALYNWYQGRAELKRSQTIHATLEGKPDGTCKAELEATGYEVGGVEDALRRLPIEGDRQAIELLAARYSLTPEEVEEALKQRALPVPSRGEGAN